MTKKHQQKSMENSTDKLSADYVVGEVSSSLFKKDSAASGSLSALFSSAPAPRPLVFISAPKPAQKTLVVKNPPEEISQVKTPSAPSHLKTPKRKSAAELWVEDRESGLKNAEKEENQTPKKSKRKISASREDEMRRPTKSLKRHNMQDEKMKLKRTIFVGNLPASCTKKMLQLLFRDKGSIESIRFRSVAREDPSMSRKLATISRKVHPKKSSINAYVVFKEEDGVVGALEKNGLEIEKDFHIRVDRVTKESSHDHKRSVFVGNLSYEMSDEALRQHFEECGKVEAVRLVRDANSGMGKGFGYVLFTYADSVQLALKLDGSKLEGRSIRVKRSVKKQKITTPGKEAIRHKGPMKDPTGTKGKGRDMKGPAREHHKGNSRFGAQRNSKGMDKRTPFKSTKGTSTFSGEMADPSKKYNKKKGLKKKQKKQKPGKPVHI